jgi:putative phosphoesterase
LLVAIISDIHGSRGRLSAVLERVRGAGALLCLGDLCAPAVVEQIAEEFPGPVHVVFGNCDGDRAALAEAAGPFGHVTCHGEFAELELGGRAVALHHEPEMAAAVAASGRYDLVCFGHTHRPETRREGRTLLVNPGDVAGRYGSCTFALYDTRSGEVELEEV